MLDKRNLTKIYIYEKLLTLDFSKYNLLWLSQFLNQSYVKTVSIIEEIDSDLSTINPGVSSIIAEDHKVVLSSSLPEATVFISYVIQKDIPFHFLINVVEEKYQSLGEFSERYYVSPSTVRRRLTPLNKFLRDYHVTLKLSTLEMIGDERNIRAILTSLLWLSSRGIDLPISCIDSEETTNIIDNSLYIRPKNDQASPSFLFRKLEADISYHRIQKKHYVEDDPCYDLVISNDLLINTNEWGKFVGAPKEYQYAETRYMAFRQYSGQVFFEENDPIFDIPKDELSKRAPSLNLFLSEFTDFIIEEIFDFDLQDLAFSDISNVLKGNISMVFFSYYVFKSNTPSLFVLTESKNMMNNKIFVHVYEKIKKKLTDLSRNADFQWMSLCLKDISMVFAAMILPDYELHAKQFHLVVSLILENDYIYNHKMEVFLRALPYIDYQVYSENINIEEYDVVIASSYVKPSENSQNKFLKVSYSLNEKVFSELNSTLHDMFLEKNKI